MEEHSIDWSSAQVTPTKRDLLELRVPVTGEVGRQWDETFNLTAQSREREARGQNWSGTRIAGRWIVVQAVEPGAERELRTYLDELVQLTNREAEEVRGREAEAAKERAEREESQKAVAEKMTERFRDPEG